MIEDGINTNNYTTVKNKYGDEDVFFTKDGQDTPIHGELKLDVLIAKRKANDYSGNYMDKREKYAVSHFTKLNRRANQFLGSLLKNSKSEGILFYIENNAKFNCKPKHDGMSCYPGLFKLHESMDYISHKNNSSKATVAKVYRILRETNLAYIHYGWVILSPALQYKGHENSYWQSVSYYKHLLKSQSNKIHKILWNDYKLTKDTINKKKLFIIYGTLVNKLGIDNRNYVQVHITKKYAHKWLKYSFKSIKIALYNAIEKSGHSNKYCQLGAVKYINHILCTKEV